MTTEQFHRSMRNLVVATGVAAALTGCYVVPLQVEQGKPPVYAYVPLENPRAGATAASAAPMLAGSQTPTTFHVRLYPMNDAAARTGALQGIVTDNLSGRGTFTVNAYGEQLQGEATRVPDNFPGFGRVITEVLGAAPTESHGTKKGIANAAGSRGMYANCEYILSARALGTGACIFSSGAKYQVHFGG